MARREGRTGRVSFLGILRKSSAYAPLREGGMSPLGDRGEYVQARAFRVMDAEFR